ncbi:MAG: 50S ribosomal protein L10 [Gemmatimonadetes bacterium]|nr:50S ribosomal protein L10 [Gemmatimonadota bacterium]
MPTTQKIAMVDQLTSMFTDSKALVFADFTGIDVASVSELRNQLREASVDYQVVKNRLAKKAVEAAGMSGLDGFLEGPTAIAAAREDPLAPAQILQKFVDNGGKIVIKTGFLDGQVLSPDQVKALASLPSREELLSKTVGTIQAPLSGLASVLNALLANLVGVISAIEKQQRGESGEDL